MIPVNESIPKEIMGTSTDPSLQDYLDVKLTHCGEMNVSYLIAIIGVRSLHLTSCS